MGTSNQKKSPLVVCSLLVFFSLLAQEEKEVKDLSYELQKDPRVLLKLFPVFKAEQRIPVLEEGDYYPCSDCHDGVDQISNPSIRKLEEEHEDIELVHGIGRFWCLRCHSAEDRDSLTSSNHEAISFDESYLLCGECHYRAQKDFFLGGHGKRIGSWDGEKILTACTTCHDPHDPGIKARKPLSPPKPRKGLHLKSREAHSEEDMLSKYKNSEDKGSKE